MEIATTAKLGHEERPTIANALTSITIASDDLEDPRRRALSHIASGQATSAEVLERATEIVEVLVERCDLERHTDYWIERMQSPVEAEPTADSHGIPVIASVKQMATVIAEARTLQHREAKDALALLRAMESFLVKPREVEIMDEAGLREFV